jgi:ribosome biogenesis GTPase
MLNGKIIKLLSGVYTVETSEGEYLCKAKGSFRKEGVSPVPGDEVEILAMPDKTGRIEKILPRRNYMIRPNVSNIDALCYVSSYSKPTPFQFTIDKMLVIAQSQRITPYLIFNKKDLPDENEVLALSALYRSLGFNVYDVSAVTKEGLEDLRNELKDKTVIFAGNTGVGKSSILNALYPDLHLQTGEISDKLGRGRHTTRHIELYPANGGLIGDTPGFGALELDGYNLNAADLQNYFDEFRAFTDQCAFLNCAHINERECGVRAASENGEINAERYNSYRQMYLKLKEDETPWSKKSNN